jgi:hypothetical protein
MYLVFIAVIAPNFRMAAADCKKDLDGSDRQVHLDLVMSIVRQTRTNALRAVFTADRARLRGAEHVGNKPAWMLCGSGPSFDTSQGLEPVIWRGG